MMVHVLAHTLHTLVVQGDAYYQTMVQVVSRLQVPLVHAMGEQPLPPPPPPPLLVAALSLSYGMLCAWVQST